MKKILFLSLLLPFYSAAVYAQSAEQFAAQQFYRYRPQLQCYGGSGRHTQSCLKHKLTRSIDGFTYVLFTGSKAAKPSRRQHPSGGTVGVFVLKQHEDGSWQTVAAQPFLASAADPSTDWQLLSLGSYRSGFVGRHRHRSVVQLFAYDGITGIIGHLFGGDRLKVRTDMMPEHGFYPLSLIDEKTQAQVRLFDFNPKLRRWQPQTGSNSEAAFQTSF